MLKILKKMLRMLKTAHAGAETIAVQHSMLSFIKSQFKTSSGLYFQY